MMIAARIHSSINPQSNAPVNRIWPPDCARGSTMRLNVTGLFCSMARLFS